MFTIYQTSDELESETSNMIIDGFRQGWPDSKIIADKNSAIGPKWLPFKSSSKDATLAQLNSNHILVTLDWPSFLVALSNKNLKNQHVHLASDLPKKYGWIKKFQKKPNTILTCASSYIQDELANQGIVKDAIHIVPPPYMGEKNEARESTSQSFMVGCVNPFMPEQGNETLIQAFHSSRELLPQIRVILVGGGEEKKRLQWLIDQLHLRSKVQLVSRQESYQRFISNFDVLVAPDKEPKGWNLSLIHALAKGIPIVATSVGCHNDIIKQGDTGLLFGPGNSTVLAQHLINLYNHPDWMKHYKEVGPKTIKEKYSLEKFKTTIEKLIN